jgi:hypothetical protein
MTPTLRKTPQYSIKKRTGRMTQTPKQAFDTAIHLTGSDCHFLSMEQKKEIRTTQNAKNATCFFCNPYTILK